MPFKKGQSGNPKGRPKSSKLFKDALSLALASKTGDRDEGLRKIADRLVANAMAGDMRAIKEVADRLDGKAPQAVIGDDDNPLVYVGQINLVAGKNGER